MDTPQPPDDGIIAVRLVRLCEQLPGTDIFGAGSVKIRPTVKCPRDGQVQSRRDLRRAGKALVNVAAGPLDGVDHGFIGGGASRVGAGQHIFGDEAIAGVGQLLRGDGAIALCPRIDRNSGAGDQHTP